MSKKQDNFFTIWLLISFFILCIFGFLDQIHGNRIYLIIICIIVYAVAIIMDYIDRREKKLEEHIDELYKNGILAEGDKK